MKFRRSRGVFFVLACALLLNGNASSDSADAQERSHEDGSVSVSGNVLAVGSADRLAVHGSGFASCAGQGVTISLLVPLAPAPGVNRIDDAPRLNSQAVSVDGSGSFTAELTAPSDFPGDWIGYVAMEGQCVVTAKQRLLSEVRIAVRLGSPVGTQLGLADSGEAIVIPATAIQVYPIMPDDPQKDPYAHFTPARVINSAGADCSDGSTSERNPRGDLVISIDSARCPSAEAVVVGPKQVSLLDPPVILKDHAVGQPVAWPPPGSGTRDPGAVPAPPAVGSTEAVSQSQSRSPLHGLGLGLLVTTAILCAILCAHRRKV